MPGSAAEVRARYRERDRLTRAIAGVALVWGVAYLVWRLLDTWSGAQPVMFVALFAGEAFGWLVLASFAFLAWRVPTARRPDIGWRPTVDVFVCTYDEGLDLLGATLVGCSRITYPHTTWVLDDGRREPVRELAARFGANYLTRPTNEHAKAGNVNHALDHTSGQVVLILDADHVPQPDILDATIGYFDDPSVAVVQTPHDFGNLDSFQHFETGRHDQSMFFEVIMPGKDRHNGAFWCGSAAVILRHALLGIGGIATETVAEDFHTTIRLHRSGWHTRYHDETLVQGLAPHDLASFLLQRDRWARGNLAVLRTPENPVVASGLSLKQRLSYISSLLAYFVPIQRLAMLAVLVAMLVTGRLPLHATLWQLALFWVPWMALNLGASSRLCRGEVSMWDGAYSAHLTTEIFLRACFVLVHPFRTSFRVTPKDGIDGGGWTAARQLRLVLAMAVVLASAIVVRALAAFGVVPLPGLRGVALAAGMGFAAWELVLVTATLWRVSRRRQVRRHYRVPVEVAGVVEGTLVRVVDLTPGGAGVLGARPVEVGNVVELRLDLAAVSGEMREVTMHLTVCSCRRAEGAGWRMGGTLTPFTAADGEALIEHCHVVSSRLRLAESGRIRAQTPVGAWPLTPGAAGDEAADDQPEHRLTASG
ncbi:MAG TPA: glycosyltransferase [Acidimicrobiales bacterium]|nr:glycosyltransferase [Acidimicrobiales bacterium]